MKLIDITHPHSEQLAPWPGDTPFEFRLVARLRDGASCNVGRLTSSIHCGTHLDAPAHFAKGGWAVDAIPVDRLVRAAVVIDISDKAKQDADYRLTAADIQAWEAKHGVVPEGSLVFVATGWDQFWPDRARYMREANGVKHFPGLAVDAANYLAHDRRVAAVGIDTPSIDHGPSKDFIVHRVINGANKPAFENLANLDRVPPKGATLIALPMKIEGGSGGPLRAIAILP